MALDVRSRDIGRIGLAYEYGLLNPIDSRWAILRMGCADVTGYR